MGEPRRCLLILVSMTAACSAETGLQPFTSDGCSLFPDSSLLSRDDWCSCCFEHDLSYWRGGTAQESETADRLLKECVFEKTNDATLATMMYEGVRVRGSPYFYNWYRWGYGWKFDRKYQALTSGESKLADRLVEEYFSTADAAFCTSK